MSFFDLFRAKGKPDQPRKKQAEKFDRILNECREELISSIPDTVTARRVDPDDSVPTPKWASISYLDAQALKFWNGKHTDFKVPDYYVNSAFGRNAAPALTRLLNNGYLALGDIRKRIAIKQVPELKAILSEHELKVSGRKAELIQRLIDNLPPSELETIFSIGVYEITDKGTAALDEYSIFFDSERLGLGFPHYRLLQEKERDPNSSNESIFLRLLVENVNKASKSRQPEQYRIAVQQMARFLETIGRPSTAMQYYCLSFFMFWHRNTVELKINTTPDVYGYISKEIDHCGQLCGYSLEQTLQEFQQALKTHNPFGFCTQRNISSSIMAFKSAISVK